MDQIKSFFNEIITSGKYIYMTVSILFLEVSIPLTCQLKQAKKNTE